MKPKSIPLKSTISYSYTVSRKTPYDKEGECNYNNDGDNISSVNSRMFVLFVDACLALCRFAVSTKLNISFDKLRANIVNSYTKKLWRNKYKTDRNVISMFKEHDAMKYNTITLSQIRASKLMYDRGIRR